MKISRTKLRPDELTPHSLLAKTLDFLRAIVGGDRFNNLYLALRDTILSLYPKKSPIQIIDYGCGMMSIPLKLESDGVIEGFIGLDIYPYPNNTDGFGDRRRYLQIHSEWPSEVGDQYHLAIITDVLHHVDTDEERIKILRDISQLTKFIIIKDHFEYGIISRQLLRFIDWIGNFAYGVKIPDKYFTKKSWQKLIADANLVEIKLQDRVKIHSGLIGFLIPQKLHFISILKKLN